MATGLATRCPACGTVFRVVPDQLRVSEGWVRCGRCSEVFNATQSLVDLDTAVARKAAPPPAPAAPPPASAPGPAPAEAPAEAPADSPVEAPAEAPARAPAPMAEAELADIEPGASRPAEFGAFDAGPPEDDAAPAAEAAMPDLDFGEDRREPAFDDAPAPAPSPSPAAAEATEAAAAAVNVPLEAPPEPAAEPSPDRSADPALDAPAPPPSAAPAEDTVLPATAAAKPGFLRRAERAERWRRPWVRALLGLGVLIGLGGLAGQLLHEYRDLAAARYPQLRPLLEQGCTWLDCRVGAARAIDSLAVESSGLVRVEGSDLYRLNVVLRNRAGIPLALPALDLALTDRQGRLIARKVLRPGELGASAETLDAGAEATLAGTLRATNGPVAGYTVELFYP